MSNLDLVVKAINVNISPKKIILFGSQATGASNKESDFDLAVIQSDRPRLGQKAQIMLTLTKLGYNWEVDPDIHLFSEADFEHKLDEKDLFASEISKGKVIYVQKHPQTLKRFAPKSQN